MAAIKDVAKRADVSIATVSHFINKTRYISPDLALRVGQAIDELGYRPSGMKNSGATKSGAVAILTVSSSGLYMARINEIQGVVQEELTKRGHNIFVSTVNEQTYHERLKALPYTVEGSVIIAVDTKQEILDQLLDQVKTLCPAHVVIGAKPSSKDICSVAYDYEDGAFKAVDHLIKRGHERIGMIHYVSDKKHLAGYQKALATYTLQCDEDLIATVSGAEETANVCARLLKVDNPPTALFTSNSIVTSEVMKYVRNQGYECPKDISVVGCNVEEWAEVCFTPLTSIAANANTIGEKAVDVLLAQLDDSFSMEGSLPKENNLPVQLIVRNSTKAIGRGPFGEQAGSPDDLELTKEEIDAIKKCSYSVAISFHYSDKAWSRLHEQGIRDTCNNLGIRVLAITNAHFDPELQIKQHESLLNMNPDVLISIPTDEDKTAESYRRIADSDTKLVLITNVPKGLTQKDYISCISVNERENGSVCGRMLGKHMIKKDKKKIGFLRHGASFFATKQRDMSAMQVIAEEFGDLETVAVEPFYSEDNAYDACTKIMKEHPEIEGLYVTWEGPAIKAKNALCDLEREDVSIVTADLDFDVAHTMAKGGIIKGLCAQRPYEQGHAMALAAANALLGKKIPSFVGVLPTAVTANNLLRKWKEIFKESPPVPIFEALRENPDVSQEGL